MQTQPENALTSDQERAVIECLKILALRGRQLREERERAKSQKIERLPDGEIREYDSSDSATPRIGQITFEGTS